MLTFMPIECDFSVRSCIRFILDFFYREIITSTDLAPIRTNLGKFGRIRSQVCAICS